jgi:hypothetical protein
MPSGGLAKTGGAAGHPESPVESRVAPARPNPGAREVVGALDSLGPGALPCSIWWICGIVRP